MDFNNWSSIGRIRIALGITVVIGFVFGFGMGFYESSLPEYSALVGALTGMTLVGLLMYRYYKRLERAGIADERSKQITYKATSIAWSGLVVVLTVVAAIATFSDLDVPVVLLVWVATMGSIVLQEVAKEYYRRQM